MKNLLILITLIFASCGVFAQEGTQQSSFSQAAPDRIQPVRLGFIASPTLNWLSVDNKELDSKGVRAGFTFGVMVDFTIAQSPNYAFATGLFMNMANGGNLRYADLRQPNQNVTSEQVMTDVNLNFQYIEVPLTLKLKTNEIGYMTYFGQLGLLGGVKLSARQSGEYQYESGDFLTGFIERENVASETQLFNAGMLVGIGTEYNITGNTNLVFGISYFHGFTNVLRRNVVQTNEKGEVLNQNGETTYGVGDIGLPGDKRRGVLRSLSLNLGVIF